MYAFLKTFLWEPFCSGQQISYPDKFLFWKSSLLESLTVGVKRYQQYSLRCFPGNFPKFFRTASFKNSAGRLIQLLREIIAVAFWTSGAAESSYELSSVRPSVTPFSHDWLIIFFLIFL